MPAERTASNGIGKRKRNTAVASGLAPGVELNRSKLPTASSWDLILQQVSSPAEVTSEHRKLLCGLAKQFQSASCQREFLPKPSPSSVPTELEDVIVITDDDEPRCTKKRCERGNPFCLNHLGQEQWRSEGHALNHFVKLLKLGRDPREDSCATGMPVGLKNLGATCYANSCLQVWFREMDFRKGVYQCPIPSEGSEEASSHPIFQLQATFSALQGSACKVFNPVRLVESLRIPQDTQQDAQEFSKLFMTLLDREFQKQSIPSVQSLVRSRFQGTQVYGTRCNTCLTASERDSDFLEIEINLKNNVKLEECLKNSLEPELLSGDNKYFCAVCQSKQDATRYSTYRTLPPTLHFSLQRFTYDFQTMTRKKSKDNTRFPTVLDMSPFVSTGCDSPIYDLRAILLHKGASCYHGHYEAQVFDDEQNSWFLFNDESVTRISQIGELSTSKSAGKKSAAVRKTNGRKKVKLRVEDSDENAPSVDPSLETDYVSSREAYMVVYSRREPGSRTPERRGQPEVPLLASNVTTARNAEHVRACEDYATKLAVIRNTVQSLQEAVKDISHTWTVADEPSVVVSRQALQAWLVTDSMTCSIEKLQQEIMRGQNGVEDSDLPMAPNSDSPLYHLDQDILCREHQLLDPRAAMDMKCISKDTLVKIQQHTNCRFVPELTTDDICPFCFESLFKEQLYQRDHPRLTEQFEVISKTPSDDDGFWISKHWLKDWQLKRPKMHTEGEDDPSPGAAEYKGDVTCTHGKLCVSTVHRKRISRQAYEFLQCIFPNWCSFDDKTEVCPSCDVEHHASKEQRRENRRSAENERNRLPFLREKNAEMLEDTPLTLIPASFLEDWRDWVSHPDDHQRPLPFSSQHFICTHNLLSLDPNDPTDLCNVAAVIRVEDFEVLASELYEGSGPLVPLHRVVLDDGSMHYVHTMDVCHACRHHRKTSWTTTEILIRTSGNRGKRTGPRQSRRLQRGKQCRMTVSKDTTVKAIKLQVQDELSIPIFKQTLFLRGLELSDATERIGNAIFVGDTVELKEEKEIYQISSEDEKPQKEDSAFEGTLLSAG